ncbi:MAG: hypothetical protein MUP98_14560 [Candidatus Aminicenantes bacterium]|nr:hypothetical protein [Candidatus Aminicenantes bacterium]
MERRTEHKIQFSYGECGFDSLLRHYHAFTEDHKAIDKIIAHPILSFMVELPSSPQSVSQEICKDISSPDFSVFDHKVSL